MADQERREGVWPLPVRAGEPLHVATVAVETAVEVPDLLGREMARAEATAGEVAVETSGWSPGAYVVRVTGAQGAARTHQLLVR